MEETLNILQLYKMFQYVTQSERNTLLLENFKETWQLQREIFSFHRKQQKSSRELEDALTQERLQGKPWSSTQTVYLEGIRGLWRERSIQRVEFQALGHHLSQLTKAFPAPLVASGYGMDIRNRFSQVNLHGQRETRKVSRCICITE